MATPDFVLALRSRVGHDLLWLTGVTSVVLDGHRVLLVRRADDGRWTPVTGIVDPGEEPADAGVREVLEEAGVVARPERLALVQTLPPITYANGDRSQYIDLVFRMGWVEGSPHPADGENTDARWFALDDLPELDDDMRHRIEVALAPDGAARFRSAGSLV
jgi:8-oxo-dGTP pyrophosphatase MutT (NUDIX family)